MTLFKKQLVLWAYALYIDTFRSQGATVLDRGHDGSVSSCKFSQNGIVLFSSISVWQESVSFGPFSNTLLFDYYSSKYRTALGKLTIRPDFGGTVPIFKVCSSRLTLCSDFFFFF